MTQPRPEAAPAEPGQMSVPAATPEPEPGAKALTPGAEEPAVRPLGSPRRRLPRTAAVALATAGLLAVAAASATVTVAVGRPDKNPPLSQAAAPPSNATPSGSPSASVSPSASAAETPSEPPVSPTPRSTVTGRVSHGAHTGDLRYFLLTLPKDAEVYGEAEGTELSLSDVAADFGNAKETKGILQKFGFRAAVERTYRTGDGTAEVTVRLIRFSSATKAGYFTQGMSLDGTRFKVSGVSGARGYLFKPGSKGGIGNEVGIFRQGDVEVEITVDVEGDPDKTQLADLMKRQQKRLLTGR